VPTVWTLSQGSAQKPDRRGDRLSLDVAEGSGATLAAVERPPHVALRRGGCEQAQRPTGCAKWAGGRACAPGSRSAGRRSSRRARSCRDGRWRRSPDIGRRCARGTRRRRARTLRGERTGGGRKPLVGDPAGRWRVVVLEGRDAKRCRARSHNIVIRRPQDRDACQKRSQNMRLAPIRAGFGFYGVLLGCSAIA